MGRVTMVIAPTMTVRTEMTIATIGRLMKNRDTLASCPRRLVSSHRDDCPVPDLQQPFDNHAFAWFQAVGHDPERPDALADRHGTDRDLVLAVYDGHLVAALQLRHRALWNEQGSRHRVCRK